MYTIYIYYIYTIYILYILYIYTIYILYTIYIYYIYIYTIYTIYILYIYIYYIYTIDIYYRYIYYIYYIYTIYILYIYTIYIYSIYILYILYICTIYTLYTLYILYILYWVEISTVPKNIKHSQGFALKNAFLSCAAHSAACPRIAVSLRRLCRGRCDKTSASQEGQWLLLEILFTIQCLRLRPVFSLPFKVCVCSSQWTATNPSWSVCGKSAAFMSSSNPNQIQAAWNFKACSTKMKITYIWLWTGG